MIMDYTDMFSYKSLGSLGDLQAARIHLITRSLNSIRMACVALLYGYYQQALTLLRMVAEDQLAARDAARYRPTLDALMNNSAQIDRPKQMAKRESPEFLKRWEDYYGLLSSYGAHPRSESISGLRAFNPVEGVHTIQPGPHYEEAWIKVILHVIGAELSAIIDTVLDLLQKAYEDGTELKEPERVWAEEDFLDLIKRLNPHLNA